MDPHDVQPEEIDVALAVQRINRATTFGIKHVRRTWAGLRTFSSDRQPVVGFDPELDGFFWLSGQGGYGIMTSPAMGRLAASLINENEVPNDLSGRRDSRHCISILGASMTKASPCKCRRNLLCRPS